jgi:hypothetical protein
LFLGSIWYTATVGVAIPPIFISSFAVAMVCVAAVFDGTVGDDACAANDTISLPVSVVENVFFVPTENKTDIFFPGSIFANCGVPATDHEIVPFIGNDLVEYYKMKDKEFCLDGLLQKYEYELSKNKKNKIYYSGKKIDNVLPFDDVLPF